MTARAPSSSPHTWVKLRSLSTPQPSVLGPVGHGFVFDNGQANAARDALARNHDGFHCFFNLSGFHNHSAHHLIASLGLAAPADFYPQAWRNALDTDLDPDFELNKKPGSASAIQPITVDNWTEHLGKYNRYWPYLVFFEDQIAEHGVVATLETFIFSDHARAAPAHMLVRLLGGLLHPLIHIGKGVEFGLDGVVAEGLAMAAVTEDNAVLLYPDGWFDVVYLDNDAPRQDATSMPGALSLSSSAATLKQAFANANPSSPRAGLPLFSVWARMGADASLAPGTATKYATGPKLATTMRSSGARIASHLAQWKTTPEDVRNPTAGKERKSDAPSWASKLSELIWIQTFLLGATNPPASARSISSKAERWKHDFFLMHTHNATLFLPALFVGLPTLSPRSRAMLLHALARTTAWVYIARGRPALYLRDTLMAPDEPVLKEGGMEEYARAARTHLDVHLVKAVRAQAYFHSWLAESTPKGSLYLPPNTSDAARDGDTGGDSRNKMEDVFKGQLGDVDETAFVRTVAQLFESQGWHADKNGEMRWTRDAVGFDEAWQ